MIGHPNEIEIRWLFAQGVSDRAMIEPTHLRAANVQFLDNLTSNFDDDNGERALLFNVEECGERIDWVAWSHKRRKLATWCCKAFALGQDSIWNPATYFGGDPLRIHPDPLSWLKADREGIVIVQPRFTYAYLRHTPRRSCGDALYAERVEQWLRPPEPTGEMLIEVPIERAAA